MKRIFLIVLAVLIIGALAIYPLFMPSSVVDGEKAKNPVEFSFEESLKTTFGLSQNVHILVNDSTIKKLELILNDSILKTWENPPKSMDFTIDPLKSGTGYFSLELRARLANGEIFVDNRSVEVVSDIIPEQLKTEVIAEFPHNPRHFTQGLEIYKGELYEGTGQKNSSFIAKIDLNSGEVKKQKFLNPDYFGEGITILNDEIYQLTWMEGTCFVYSLDSFTVKRQFNYDGEGWGICNNGKELIMSDGSNRLTFRDPQNFKILRTIQVYSNLGAQLKLNELEYVDGKIYANIWTQNKIVVIDAGTGRILAEVDATELMNRGRNGGEVLNGIAYDQAAKKFYFTGKYWSKLLHAELVPAN